MKEIIRGIARKFGNDINADEACQFYKNMSIDLDDTEGLAAICMTGYAPDFPQRAGRGDILVAGKNFASGHLHAHFYLSLKAFGIGAVIAESMNRRFYREAINCGLAIMVCPSTKVIQNGDEIEVNLKKGEIRILKSNIQVEGESISPILFEILEKGGLEDFIRHKRGA